MEKKTISKQMSIAGTEMTRSAVEWYLLGFSLPEEARRLKTN
jgi:hypothetical protein